MGLYPGRFLTEIEAVEDWPRLMRVVQARHIEFIEGLAIQQKAGLVKPENISPRQWDDIRENQQLVEQAEALSDGTESN